MKDRALTWSPSSHLISALPLSALVQWSITCPSLAQSELQKQWISGLPHLILGSQR